MERGFCTESEVVELLIDIAKQHDDAPIVLAAKRTGGKNRVQRMVTFVIRVASGNESLVNALVKLSIDSNLSLWFDGSEINLQDGQMEIDYLYVSATVSPNIGG